VLGVSCASPAGGRVRIAVHQPDRVTPGKAARDRSQAHSDDQAPRSVRNTEARRAKIIWRRAVVAAVAASSAREIEPLTEATVPNSLKLAALLLALLPYAVLGIFIVMRTGSTSGLRDFAEVVRALCRRRADPP